MFRHKRSVYIIALSLIGLMSMQGMWLYYAIKQEEQFLNIGTRQAAIESLAVIEQKEDSKLLLTELDTVFELKSVKIQKPNQSKNTEVRVMVIDGKTKMTVKNTINEKITSYSYTNGVNNTSGMQVISGSNEIRIGSPEDKKMRGKAKNYEQLLKKIVYQSKPKKIEERINFKELNTLLTNNLKTRGVNLVPELAVKDSVGKTIFKTPNYKSSPGIILPMFARDIVFQNYTLNIFYPSTLTYIFKKAIGVIVLSLFVTLLLITVILLLYRKMLTEQKLNRYKSDFINNLTHELKTPLATISLANSNISSAANYSNQNNIKQYTQIIDEENKRLNNHIEKVFELSLLEKEKQIFNLEPVNIHHLIRDCALENTRLLESKNARLELKLEAKEYTVKVDRFHLTNALSNLIDNAVKYNEGIIEIEIETRNEKETIITTVKDNGIGISKEHQKFIFDKFFRVTTKDLHNTKGFGIGLSYVKQTIELFNGRVTVRSEENKGTEFNIILPYAKS